MHELKIHYMTERVVVLESPQTANDASIVNNWLSTSLTRPTTTFLYDITFSLDGGHSLIRIERSKTDIVCLVQALVLYFPSYQFSAQTLFQPPDQHIRDLVELQEFLNRIFSIDVGNRMIQYPKIVGFFDGVFGRSVVQRSLMRQNLRAVGGFFHMYFSVLKYSFFFFYFNILVFISSADVES